MVCGVSGSLFGGKVMAMTGRYYWLTVASVCISILGAITIFLFSGLVLDFSWGMVIGLGMVMFGGGSGTYRRSTFLLIQECLKRSSS
jgi:hypothetical protein